MTSSQHVYEVRPRKDRRGFDLISDALPFGRLWYDGPNATSNAIGYASQYSRSHDAVIRVYDEWQRDRDARARGRFQRVVTLSRFRLDFASYSAQWALPRGRIRLRSHRQEPTEAADFLRKILFWR